jgi:hypothetical protein
MKLTLGIIGVAALLAVSVSVGIGIGSPAQAATAATATLKGHVRNADGDPIAHLPITVGYFANGDTSQDGSSLYSHTDANGRYSVKIPGSHDIEIVFGGPSTKKYLVVAKTDFSVDAGSSHRINRTLARVSTIAGTVTDAAGSAVEDATVTAYDATTGKRMIPTELTNSAGHFHLGLPAGSYKIRFATDSIAQWFGDEMTRSTSPTVTVTDGGKTAGTNEQLTP